MKGWTVLFFIYVEDEETSQYATELLQELLRINHSDNLTLLLFESAFDFKTNKGTSCRLYEIKSSKSWIKRKKVELTSFDHMNPGDTKLLEVTLSYIKKKKKIRDRFLLFTWDHGAGFGIFNNDPRPQEIEAPVHRMMSLSLDGASAAGSAGPSAARSAAPAAPLPEPVAAPPKKVLQVVTNRRSRQMNFKHVNAVDPSGIGTMMAMAAPARSMAAGAAARSLTRTGETRATTARIGERRATRARTGAGDGESTAAMSMATASAANSDEPLIDMLTASEINKSLQQAGVKADLMIMMNCWTQMLETGSELSDTVNILVAPETIYYFEGYDYFVILNSIVRKPSISAEQLAKVAVDSIESFFYEDPDWAQCTERIVVSAVRPPAADKLIKAIDKFFEPLLQLKQTKYNQLRKCRQDCLDLSKNYFFTNDEIDNTYLHYFIDLLNYAAALTAAKFTTLAEYKKLEKACNDYVLHLYRGNEFKAKNPVTGSYAGNGFSIFHPERLVPDFDGQLYYGFFYKNEFLKISKATWGKYLAFYREQQVV